MTRRMTRAELIAAIGCDEAFVLRLETEELVHPEQGGYGAGCVERARVAWNLHEVGVNQAGLEVALHLLERLHEERRRHLETIAWLRQRLEDERRG